MNINGIKVDDFTVEALRALFWTEEETEGLHYKTIFDIDKDSLIMFFNRCKKFQEENSELLDIIPENNGHNFVLSCNGHGSGFFDEYLSYKEDRELIEETGNKLQEKCRKEKPFYIFLGEDEKVYIESM